MRKSWGSKADPLLRDHKKPYNSRAIIDACRPYERLGDFPPVVRASSELRDAVARKFDSQLKKR